MNNHIRIRFLLSSVILLLMATVAARAQVSLSIPTLPPGKSIVITYTVTINDPLSSGTCQISNQGSVSGDNIDTKLTDDPDIGGVADPTVTPIDWPAPIVTMDPENTSACVGGTATFTAAATGTPTPTLQWQVSTDGGANFNDLPGETSTTLSFTTTPADDGNQYRAVFTTTCNASATTAAATLTLNSGPQVTGNPSDQTVCAGNMASFTAAATGTPTPTVQWQLSTDGGANFNDISGETSTTLSFTAIASQNGYRYRAAFSNSCSDAATSSAVLTVNTAPFITMQPQSAAFCPTTTASFSVAATGSPAPSIQWQVSTDGGANFNDISGETDTVYSFTVSAGDNGNQYRAVLTNICNTVTSDAATLSTAGPITVNTSPSDQTVCAGTTATFTASASGSPTPSVQWQVSTDGGANFNDIPSATSTTLSFTAMVSQNGYKYRAVFANTCTTATTSSATLTVNAAPAVTTNPTDQTVCAGESATFTAAATGTPTPGVQWQVSTDNGTTFSDISGATSTSYTIASPTPAMNGNKYHAVFTNTCGTATTSNATLTVSAAPTLSVSVSPTTLWPPNHKMRDIAVTLTVNGNCAPQSIVLESITSNESANNFYSDASFNTTPADVAFKLKAERNGSGNGRVYTITYKMTYSIGGGQTADAYATATVTVPHNQSKPVVGAEPVVEQTLSSRAVPNPFSESATIEFTLPKNAVTSLRIVNVQGDEVARLIDGERSAGVQTVQWNGVDRDGKRLPAGAYLYIINADGQQETGTIVLLR